MYNISRDKLGKSAETRLKSWPSPGEHIFVRTVFEGHVGGAITTVLYIPPTSDITNPLVSAISTFSPVTCTLFSPYTPLYPRFPRIQWCWTIQPTQFFCFSPFLFTLGRSWTRRQILISDICVRSNLVPAACAFLSHSHTLDNLYLVFYPVTTNPLFQHCILAAWMLFSFLFVLFEFVPRPYFFPALMKNVRSTTRSLVVPFYRGLPLSCHVRHFNREPRMNSSSRKGQVPLLLLLF